MIVELVTVCPYGWPNWDKCTKIQLKIPLFVQNNDTYELTGAHIREMWNSMSKNELAVLGMKVCHSVLFLLFCLTTAMYCIYMIEQYISNKNTIEIIKHIQVIKRHYKIYLFISSKRHQTFDLFSYSIKYRC